MKGWRWVGANGFLSRAGGGWDCGSGGQRRRL